MVNIFLMGECKLYKIQLLSEGIDSLSFYRRTKLTCRFDLLLLSIIFICIIFTASTSITATCTGECIAVSHATQDFHT